MTDADFELEEIADDLVRIELAGLAEVPEALARPINVYLVEGPTPALINAGHPGHADALGRALRSRGLSPASIERIIATSWEIDVLGGAAQFPRADLFVASPDMQAPRDYEMQLQSRRRRFVEVAREIAEVDDGLRVQPVEEATQRYFPRMTRDLRFAPLRNGQFVRAGSLRLEVLATGGPGPGHLALYDEDRQLLFCGDFSLSGLPDRLDDTQSYIVSMERLAELSSRTALPNSGRVYDKGRWTVARAANFLNNFLSNAPSALVRQPTVIEFVERDRGYTVDEPMELVVAYDRYRELFEELVRTRTVAAEGEGAGRRYGVDVDDPRGKVRPHSDPEYHREDSP